MSKIQLGYVCINMELSERPKKQRITTNRGMIKRTFKAKGIAYASELAELNTRDILPVLEWNQRHNIKVFRMSSCLFPWASEYMLEDLPQWEKIVLNLKRAGDYAKENGIRLSFHPGPFNILSSNKEHVVTNSIVDLSIHGKIMDIMGMPRSHYAKINIHIGAAYGDRVSAIDRFCKNFERLNDSVRSRLTVENDDRANLFSTKDLYYGVYKKVGTPIVFDYHHHKFRNNGDSEQDALAMAVSTWGKIIPTCHYSESACLREGKKKVLNAHSDYIYDKIENYGHRLDIVIEAKAKEKALMKYRKDWMDGYKEDNKIALAS
jgi:UV DNA damage endonuclease